MSKKIITTAGTEFAQNGADLAMIEQTQRAGKPVMISSTDLNEGFSNAEADVKALVGFDVEGEEITVDPTTSKQTKTPSKGKNAITKVTVNAVTSAIDANIVAGNIKKDVEILGVTGTYEGGSPTPEIIPVVYDYDGSTNLYKNIYLKKENFTIPYSAELAAEISAAIAAGEQGDNMYAYIKKKNASPDSSITRIDLKCNSDSLAIEFSVYNGTISALIEKYYIAVDGETISVSCSNLTGISTFTDNTNGLYLGEDSDGYPDIIVNLLYSTTADVIIPDTPDSDDSDSI